MGLLCKICDSTFSQSQSLKWHKTRQHDKKFFDNNLVPLKQKIYKCDICQKLFSDNGNLKSHFDRVHGDKAYKCDICDKLFTAPNSLKAHIFKQHCNIQDVEKAI